MEYPKTTRDALSGWPDDWYVYDGEKVRGPLSATETFTFPNSAAHGQKQLVSRKGFSQWYGLHDLSELFNLTAAMGRRVESEMVILKRSSELASHPETRVSKEGASDIKRSQVMVGKASPRPQVYPQHHAPKSRIAKGQLSRENASSLAHPVDQGKPDTNIELKSSPPVRPSPADVDFLPEWGVFPSDQGHENKDSDKGNSKGVSFTKQTLMREYIQAKARLRLGEMRQPWILGLVGIPLTCGVYWPVWFRDLMVEIRAHRSSEAPWNFPSFWWVALPIVHCFMIYRLAKALRELEYENRYASTVPWIAALLAIFPPFATVYLQRAANKHWSLHVRYVMASAPKPG